VDHINRFESRATYQLLRAEYCVALLASVGLFLWHLGDVRWVAFVGFFLYIDVIGYLPGALAFHRSHGRSISRRYYVLYNTMHSFLTQAAVAGLWAWLVQPEWALLAIPIHLCGDRGLFGNFLKPFSVPFEPTPIRAFEDFQRLILLSPRAEPDPVRPVPTTTS
jgi:hypothetical protein